MIVLRTKIFSRRDQLPSTRFDDIPEEWGGGYDRVIFDVAEKKNYAKEYQQLGNIDKERVKGLRKDLKNGYIYSDGPNGGDTHYLEDFSNKNKHWVSKEINTCDRMNYIIYPPMFDEENRQVIVPIKIQSLLGHTGPGQKEYSRKH